MKIATITYSNAQNYGAMLQAYALSAYIKDLGFECKVVDYREFDDRWFKPRKDLADVFWTIFLKAQSKRRIERYRLFRAEFLDTTDIFRNYHELDKLNDLFDTFITGSDQVWNCTNGANCGFFLEFVNEDKNMISYAPSFGIPQIPEKYIDTVVYDLKRIKHISVRESSGAKLIESLIGKQVPVVVDPVFLKRAEDWKKISADISIKEPFVFVYSTQKSKSLNKAVKDFANKHKLTVVSTHAIPGCKCIVRKDIGPLEFLGCILNANYVISTSFHATAFSIIFNKDFCVVPHSQTGSRVTDLLYDANLEECIWKNNGYNFQNVDYTSSGICALLDRINDSKIFLKNSLENKHD